MTRTAPSGWHTLPLYLGGFMGPFGTLIVIPMFPELRQQFGVDSTTISWAFSAYLLPMAALLLVSGTIGERYGRRLVLRLAFGAFVVASLASALAPTLAVFLASRAAQGTANAFFTPLLIAGLAELTPEEQLGRRVGIYASFQAAGGALAPFIGGLAADVDWRWAFVGAAAVSVVLAVLAPPGAARSGVDRPPIRPLLAPRPLALGVASFAAAAGPLGAGVLVGFKTRDLLGMEPTTAGLLLAAGNVGAAVIGPPLGRALDRYGARRFGVTSALTVSALVAALGVADTVTATAVVYVLAGSLVNSVVIVLQKVGASIVPDNRAGALSAILSFRFAGHALGPLAWVPIFARSETAAFVGSGLLGLVTAVALMAVPPSEPAPVPAEPGEPPGGRDGPVASAGWPARRTTSRARR